MPQRPKRRKLEVGNTSLIKRLVRLNLHCSPSCDLCSHCRNFCVSDVISSNLSMLCVHLISETHSFGLIWDLRCKLYFLKEQSQDNRAHSKFFFKCSTAETLLRAQNKGVCQWSRKQGETVLKLTNYIYIYYQMI